MNELQEPNGVAPAESERVDHDPNFLNFLPGQRLRKARELRGLLPEQVARELNLPVRFVQAIESDDYHGLPEPAFVRGYMRRYAQLVKLSPDDIAAKFDQSWAADKSLPAQDVRPSNPIQVLGMFTKQPRVRLGRLLSLASVLLLLALVLGSLFWAGFERLFRVDAELAPNNSAPIEQTVVSPVVTPAETMATPAVTTEDAISLPNPNSAVLPEPASVQPTPLPAPVAPPAVPAGLDALRLSFTGDSWVKVTDAQGRVVAQTLRHAGQSLSLSGRGPFQVNLGNAPAVTVTFNGQAVDVKPFTTGLVATFSLAR